mmetsp:Transcript_1974/g.1956  ORF Transcript_1974/g.1956 Transcript_1974/m.1956 type:complete len:204 (-) Transcript_1974:373-984(-)
MEEPPLPLPFIVFHTYTISHRSTVPDETRSLVLLKPEVIFPLKVVLAVKLVIRIVRITLIGLHRLLLQPAFVHNVVPQESILVIQFIIAHLVRVPEVSFHQDLFIPFVCCLCQLAPLPLFVFAILNIFLLHSLVSDGEQVIVAVVPSVILIVFIYTHCVHQRPPSILPCLPGSLSYLLLFVLVFHCGLGTLLEKPLPHELFVS